MRPTPRLPGGDTPRRALVSGTEEVVSEAEGDPVAGRVAVAGGDVADEALGQTGLAAAVRVLFWTS